jgi:protein-L-isoaspartate(D-aspartate) O-methyltransferase
MEVNEWNRRLSAVVDVWEKFAPCNLLCLLMVFCCAAFVPSTAFSDEAVSSPKACGEAKAPCPEITWKSAKEFEASIQSCRKTEEQKYLQQRYSRALVMISNKDLVRDCEIRAFLLTPREKFCRPWNLSRVYDHAFLDIHYGVTISGPHLVGRMTSALDVQPGDKVLEIGTGSGYHSAMISYLTDKVYTIEIIAPLEKETDGIYEQLAGSGYPEYANIKRKSDDGYYGWEEFAPFDKIIVTCGIDHIPPPLLKQLKVGGVMVIPVGPPGAQVILKVAKTQDDKGNIVVSREDIYHGRKKEAFVPLTNKEGGTHFK